MLHVYEGPKKNRKKEKNTRHTFRVFVCFYQMSERFDLQEESDGMGLSAGDGFSLH